MQNVFLIKDGFSPAMKINDFRFCRTFFLEKTVFLQPVLKKSGHKNTVFLQTRLKKNRESARTGGASSAVNFSEPSGTFSGHFRCIFMFFYSAVFEPGFGSVSLRFGEHFRVLSGVILVSFSCLFRVPSETRFR